MGITLAMDWKGLWSGIQDGLMTNLPYLVLGHPELHYQWGASFTTGLLLVTWLVFVCSIRQDSSEATHQLGGVDEAAAQS